MKHIITTTLLLVLALLLPTHALAHDFEVDGIYYNIINSNEVEVTYQETYDSQYSNEYSGSVTIPATVTNNGTTYSVTTIGSSAFWGCSSLTNINIPNSVTNIGENAFSGCSSLESILVASDNPNYDSRNNCNAIIETATNTLIAGCKNTTIPNSVTTIGNYSFRECYSLTNIDIPNSVTNIGNQAFYGCTGLTDIDIPNSVTAIDNSAFSECTSLITISIPNSVTNIGYSAFSDCSKLMSVTIEGPISRIQHSTFYNCRKLQTVRLPYDLISIEEKAFYFCEDLTDVTCLAKTPPSIEKYNSIYPGYYMATLHVPAQSVEAYKATDWWSHFINIEGDASNDASDPATSPVNKCDTNDDGEVNIADINKVIDAILTN